MLDFYQDYGDCDGQFLSRHIHLPSDPFVNEADFWLPKLILLFFGLVALSLESLCRAYGVNNTSLCVVTSTIHYFSLLIWISLILISTVMTVTTIYRQPFPYTRPTQLTVRVLAGHVFLYFMIVIFYIFYIVQLRMEEDSNLQNDATVNEDEANDTTNAQFLMFGSILFRYLTSLGVTSTWTASLDAKICIAVEVFVTSFIFLPPCRRHQSTYITHQPNVHLDESFTTKTAGTS
jgi:hypothetical protein